MLPSEIVKLHREELLKLMQKYPRLTNLRIFGSVARGEDTEESDIDFVVDSGPDATLFDMADLLENLEELLGIKVDLVSSGGCKAYMNESIKREAICIDSFNLHEDEALNAEEIKHAASRNNQEVFEWGEKALRKMERMSNDKTLLEEIVNKLP
jgi:predicted nucleotidyltransferase